MGHPRGVIFTGGNNAVKISEVQTVKTGAAVVLYEPET
jgi:hypothetical protein